jgi:hypothetical protein
VLLERRQSRLRPHATVVLTKSWRPFAIGFVTFIAAHIIQAAKWTEWFHGQYRPWFMNSGRAVLGTAAAIFVASVLSRRASDPPLAHGVRIALGAAAAMVLVLFGAGDSGTIFPIVLVLGGAVIAVSAVGGALAVAAIRPR